MIEAAKKDNWFSNFKPFEIPLKYQGLVYKTPEHFYQALKTLNKKEREDICYSSTPGQAKRLGRKCKVRADWEIIKLRVMENALRYKFQPGTKWNKMLKESKGEIVEWNTWHDNFWGNCTCSKCVNIKGKNHLGKILMKLREENDRSHRNN